MAGIEQNSGGNNGLIKDVIKHTFVFGHSAFTQNGVLFVQASDYRNKKIILNIEETTNTTNSLLNFSLLIQDLQNLLKGESIVIETRSLQARGAINFVPSDNLGSYPILISMNATYLLTKETVGFSFDKISDSARVIDVTNSNSNRRVGFGKYAASNGGSLVLRDPQSAVATLSHYEEIEMVNKSAFNIVITTESNSQIRTQSGAIVTSYTLLPNKYFKAIYYQGEIIITI
jgi:predicted secreted protein